MLGFERGKKLITGLLCEAFTKLGTFDDSKRNFDAKFNVL